MMNAKQVNKNWSNQQFLYITVRKWIYKEHKPNRKLGKIIKQKFSQEPKVPLAYQEYVP